MEPEEVDALISNLPEMFRGAPVKARFIFAWETGLRPETTALIRSPGDYAKGRKTLRIRDEADKARYGREVPLSQRARDALDSVCPEVGIIFGHHTYKGLLRRAARDGGLPEEKASKITAYDFRHSRATHWVEHSQNLAGVAFLLGHREVTTLNKYVKPGQRAAEKVLAQVAVQGSKEGPKEAPAEVPDQVSFEDHLRTADDLLEPEEPAAAATPTGTEDGNPNKKGPLLEGASVMRKGGFEPPQCLHHWNLNQRPTCQYRYISTA